MLGHDIDYPQLSVENVSVRAQAYDIPGSTHDGCDVIGVYQAAGEAVGRAREGGGPTLLEFKVHQIEGNLEGRLEVKEEEKVWCPIHNLGERLTEERALDPDLVEAIMREEEETVKDAMDYALRSMKPRPMEAFTGVFGGT
jgi:pyruvate dehydrogenase E1 component alpha subunit